MAVLKAGSTLGANVISTIANGNITADTFSSIGGLSTSYASGASIFKHSNGTFQYGYLREPVPVPQGEIAGWAVAGRSPTVSSTIDRVAFASDSPSTSTTPTAAFGQTAGSNPSYVYTHGGRTSTSTYPSSTGSIYKYSTTSGSLTTSWSDGALGNYHWLGEGTQSPTNMYWYSSFNYDTPFRTSSRTSASIYKFPFSSESASTWTSSTPNRNYGGTAWTDASSKGYFGQGQTINPAGPETYYGNYYSLTYSNETVNLWVPTPSNGLGKTSFNSLDAGYTTGGSFPFSIMYGPSPFPLSSAVLKFPFASATSSTVSNLLVSLRLGAGSSGISYGYVSGGQTATGYSDNIYKVVYASDSTNSDVGELSQARSETAGAQS